MNTHRRERGRASHRKCMKFAHMKSLITKRTIATQKSSTQPDKTKRMKMKTTKPQNGTTLTRIVRTCSLQAPARIDSPSPKQLRFKCRSSRNSSWRREDGKQPRTSRSSMWQTTRRRNGWRKTIFIEVRLLHWPQRPGLFQPLLADSAKLWKH